MVLISDLLDQQLLSYIEQVFAESKSGDWSLRADEFRQFLSRLSLPSSLIESVYRAIDTNDVGVVTYSDFTSYLIASEAGSSFSEKTFISRLVLLGTQDMPSVQYVHRDFIDCLVYLAKPVGLLMSGGRDGQLAMWDPDSLNLVRLVDHRDKNSVLQKIADANMGSKLKAQISGRLKAFHKRKPTKMAITAIRPLLNWGLLAVGSADCCVTVYELPNLVSCSDIFFSMSVLEVVLY